MMIWLGGVEIWYIEELLWALAITAAGVAMFCSGMSIDRSLKRYNKYLAVVGDYEAMAVEQLSRTLGYPRDRVEKDLQKMIDKGYFGDEAYLNMELGYLFRSGQADAELKQKRRQEQAQEAAAAPPPKETEEGYSGILRRIRRANDAIADEALSAKIDRLETITAKIFRAVEPPRSCWTPTRSSRPPGWRGRTSARPRPGSSPPWTSSSRALNTSWTSCTRPTPWMWTATSG